MRGGKFSFRGGLNTNSTNTNNHQNNSNNNSSTTTRTTSQSTNTKNSPNSSIITTTSYSNATSVVPNKQQKFSSSTITNIPKRQRGGAVHNKGNRGDSSNNNSNPTTDAEDTSNEPHTVGKKQRTDTATTETTNNGTVSGKFQLSSFRNKSTASPSPSVTTTTVDANTPIPNANMNSKTITFGNRTNSASSVPASIPKSFRQLSHKRLPTSSTPALSTKTTMITDTGTSNTQNESETVVPSQPVIDNTAIDADNNLPNLTRDIPLPPLDLPFIESIPQIDDFIDNDVSINNNDHSHSLPPSLITMHPSELIPITVSDTNNDHTSTHAANKITNLSSVPSHQSDIRVYIIDNIISTHPSSSIDPSILPLVPSSLSSSSSSEATIVLRSHTPQTQLLPLLSNDYNFQVTTVPTTVEEDSRDPVLALLAAVQREKESSKQYSLKLIKTLEYGLSSTPTRVKTNLSLNNE